MKDKPELKLVGEDGNAFAILARAKSVAQDSGWSEETIKIFLDKATSGDYNKLLTTCGDYFSVC